MDNRENGSVPSQSARAAATRAIIRTQNLCKNYYLGRNVVPALRNVNIEVARGEFVAVMGPSGSGKSTLMNLLGCLDRPSSGVYILDGIPVSQMSTNELADIRNQKIGFIFQGFNLLPRMTALENIELPLVYSGIPSAERRQRATQALAMVGLSSRASHRPTELSGGQQQRVAIARALVTQPAIVLADEPTGSLDSHTSLEIMMILQRLNARGITVVLVTHDAGIASYCQRQIKFRDGMVIQDSVNQEQVMAREQLLQQNQQKKQVVP